MNKNSKPTDWNKDGVWEKVEDRLHKKKKRRFLFWWLFGGASIAIGLFIFTLLNDEGGAQALQGDISQTTTSKEQTTVQQSNLEKEILKEEIGTMRQSSTDKVEDRIKQNEIIEPAIKRVYKSIAPSVLSSPPFISEPQSIEYRPSQKYIESKIFIDPVQALVSSSLLRSDLLIDSIPVLPLSTFAQITSDTTALEKVEYFSAEVELIEKPKLFWWVDSGIGFGKRSYTGDDILSAYRINNESFKFAHTSGVGIQYFLFENVFLKLGVGYQTIYETYENETSAVDTEVIISDEAVQYDLPNGIQYFESGPLTTTTTTNRFIIHNNFIHRWSIPVELGVAFQNKSWSLEPAVGLRTQLFQRFDGVLAEDGVHLFDLDQINDAFYAKGFNVGLMASINLKYALSKNGSLGLRAAYERDNVFGLYKDSPSSRYETMGLQLGYYFAF